MTKHTKQNKPLVDHIYTADPSAHVFEGKLYIYPSHDFDHDGPSTHNGDQMLWKIIMFYQLEDIIHLCRPWGGFTFKRYTMAKNSCGHQMQHIKIINIIFILAKDKDDIFRIGVATSDQSCWTIQSRRKLYTR